MRLVVLALGGLLLTGIATGASAAPNYAGYCNAKGGFEQTYGSTDIKNHRATTSGPADFAPTGDWTPFDSFHARLTTKSRRILGVTASVRRENDAESLRQLYADILANHDGSSSFPVSETFDHSGGTVFWSATDRENGFRVELEFYDHGVIHMTCIDATLAKLALREFDEVNGRPVRPRD